MILFLIFSIYFYSFRFFFIFSILFYSFLFFSIFFILFNFFYSFQFFFYFVNKKKRKLLFLINFNPRCKQLQLNCSDNSSSIPNTLTQHFSEFRRVSDLIGNFHNRCVILGSTSTSNSSRFSSIHFSIKPTWTIYPLQTQGNGSVGWH